MLRYSRRGAGETLVLLHGLGSYRGAWDPVVPALAARVRRAGRRPARVRGVAAAAGRAGADAGRAGRRRGRAARRLGIDRPHVAGNSLGGWVALELAAHARSPRSRCSPRPASGPAGTPRYARLSLRAVRGLIPPAGAAADRADAVPRGPGGRAGAGLRPARPDDPGAGPRGDQGRPPAAPASCPPCARPPTGTTARGGDRRTGHRRVRLARPPAAVPHVPARRAAARRRHGGRRCPAAATSR